MAQEIHYEIYRRQGSKGGWVLHDVTGVRENAIRAAEELMAEQRATGVKVVKETYNPDTGDYLSLKIFEEGHTKLKTDAAAEDVPHALPCFKPDDLYSYHARATMARLLCDFLARQKLTVTELIHRADSLERLEATGTLFQHCVQKIAVAQAASTAASVQQIIKSLNDLTTKAIARVYRDSRRKYFPVARPGQFGVLVEKLATESDGLYLLNGALARYLGEAKTWNEKLLNLLALMLELPDEGPGRTLLMGAIDTLVAEVLNGAAALHELIGETENLGEALLVLVELFLGQLPEDQAKHKGLTLLARHFHADELPDARSAVARRITAELRSVRRLCPTSLVLELKILRRIANKLVLGEGKYLSHDEIIASFTLRSRRLVAHESDRRPSGGSGRARRQDRTAAADRGKYRRRGEQAAARELCHADPYIGGVRILFHRREDAPARTAPAACRTAGARQALRLPGQGTPRHRRHSRQGGFRSRSAVQDFEHRSRTSPIPSKRPLPRCGSASKAW